MNERKGFFAEVRMYLDAITFGFFIDYDLHEKCLCLRIYFLFFALVCGYRKVETKDE